MKKEIRMVCHTKIKMIVVKNKKNIIKKVIIIHVVIRIVAYKIKKVK